MRCIRGFALQPDDHYNVRMIRHITWKAFLLMDEYDRHKLTIPDLYNMKWDFIGYIHHFPIGFMNMSYRMNPYSMAGSPLIDSREWHNLHNNNKFIYNERVLIHRDD
jgi:hypothetical protein